MGDKKVILIADDDAELRQVLSMRLVSAGYEVIEAANGKGAMNLAKEKKPDLVILDIMMPQMDGMSLSQRFKEGIATKDIPLIFLTGLVDKDTETHDPAAGQNIIFAKPYDANELLAAIESLIGK
ncbi:PleD family two-component system response regulator [Candidatus Omnitrophota bacterium]